MYKKESRNFVAIIFILLAYFTVSCVPYDKLRYFNDIDEIVEPAVNPRVQKLIAPFDNLYIKVLSIDENTSNIFDPNSGTTGVQVLVSYLVDEKGYINFPFVGNINLAGLTLAQASAKMQAALSEYVSRTSVIVRFVENKISVLGQVQNQGVFSFTQDKLTIYEALALSGGITNHGDRRNIVLIRQVGDKITTNKINLADSKIASKDFYYVLPNDVITVEPMKSISWYNFNSNTYSTILTSFTTLLALVAIYMQSLNLNQGQ